MTQKIATDGVGILVHYAHDDLARAADGQRPFREMIDDYFSTKVPVDAIVDLWLAGESLEDVAYEYGLTRGQVEAICRVTRAA